MKKSFLLLFLVSVSCIAQIKTNGFELEVKKTKVLPKFYVQTDNLYINYDKDKEKQIKVKIKVKSLSGRKLFDPNKFYFVNKVNKLRFRPSTIRRTTGFGSMVSYLLLSHEKIKDAPDFIRYEPKIKDTFYNYSIEGLKDVERTSTFGRTMFRTKSEASTYYFKPEKLKKKTVDVLLIVPKEMTAFELYYGKKKVTTFTLK